MSPPPPSVRNLDAPGRRRRATIGVTALAVSLVAAFALPAAGVERAWRSLLLFPFLVAFVHVFEALEGT